MPHRFALVLALLLAPGCGGPSGGSGDAGAGGSDAFVDREDAASEVDAAGAEDAGIGIDASGRDASVEGDAGPILPERDAGDPFGDAGPDGPPAWAPLTVLTDGSACEALVACGGDEVGTWDVSGGCVEIAVPEELMMCPGASVSAVGMARGRVTFTGTSAVRTAQSEVVASLFVPGFCAAFVGGCSGIETMLRMRVADSACRESATSDCTCELRQSNVIDDADDYTIEGDQIVSATLGRRWDYCVEPDGTLRYRDVTASGPVEPGIISLTPR